MSMSQFDCHPEGEVSKLIYISKVSPTLIAMQRQSTHATRAFPMEPLIETRQSIGEINEARLKNNVIYSDTFIKRIQNSWQQSKTLSPHN